MYFSTLFPTFLCKRGRNPPSFLANGSGGVTNIVIVCLFQEWKSIRGLLGRTGKEGLKRQCTTLDPSTIDINVAKVAERKYFNKHTLESITDISAGVGTFYAWVSLFVSNPIFDRPNLKFSIFIAARQLLSILKSEIFIRNSLSLILGNPDSNSEFNPKMGL